MSLIFSYKNILCCFVKALEHACTMKQIDVSINRIRSAHDVIEFYPQSHHYNDIETGSSFIKDQKISWETPCLSTLSTKRCRNNYL